MIEWLRMKQGKGQPIREDGPASHLLTKRGTPTMGGIVFIIGSILGYLVGHAVSGVPWTMVGVLVLAMMAGLGLVGFVDDFLKTRKQQSLGLGGWIQPRPRHPAAGCAGLTDWMAGWLDAGSGWNPASSDNARRPAGRNAARSEGLDPVRRPSIQHPGPSEACGAGKWQERP